MTLKEEATSEREKQQPLRAYLFDIDGVLTNPLNVPMTKEGTLDALSERMFRGVIGFNSGQSLSFIEQQVLEPLEARVRDKRELHHLIAIGEKGGAWITYDQDGRRSA